MSKCTGKNFPRNRNDCSECNRLDRQNNFIRKTYLQSNMPIGTPWIDKDLQFPHKCTFQRLCYIEYLYKGKILSKALYDRWMQEMGGDYQICGSPKLMYLWKEVPFTLRMYGNNKSKKRIHTQNLMVYKEEYDVYENGFISFYKHSKFKQVRFIKVNLTKVCDKKRSNIKIINKLFPFTTPSDQKKSNIDFATCFNAIRNNYPNAQNTLNDLLSYLPIGTYNSIAVAMLFHYYGNDNSKRMFEMIKSDNANVVNPTILNTYLKSITTALRRTQTWPNGDVASLDDVTQCSYWELCIGRSIMKSNWKQEYENRMLKHLPLCLPHDEKQDVNTDCKFRIRLRKHLIDIMSELVDNKFIWPTYRIFVMDRQSWLSGGSSGGQSIIYDDKKLPIDKRTYFEHLSSEEIISWLRTEPKICAVASEKFEQSKARAIYGTKCIDYTIMTYVIYKIEPHLSRINGVENGLVGTDELKCLLRRQSIVQGDDVECSMLDYADFNKQHTLEAQSLVFETLACRLEQCQAEPDVIRAARWCEKALLNQWTTFPDRPGEHKVIQGLFSGIRGTNFINTILNVAYYRVNQEYVNKIFQLESNNTYNIHQGDDVWLSSNSRVRNITEFHTLKACGFEVSNSKQMQGVCVGEFLRVMYHKQGLKGFLARAIGTFIERPLQAESDVAPSSRATGINSQIAVLFRRGMRAALCTAIWKETMRFQLTSNMDGNTANIPVYIAEKHYLDNGLDIGPPLTMALLGVACPKIPTLKLKNTKMFNIIPRNTSHDWIILISERYQEAFKSKTLEDNLHRANIAGSIPAREKRHCRNLLHIDLRLWKEDLKQVKNISNTQRNTGVFLQWLHHEKKCSLTQTAIDEIFASMNVKKSLHKHSPVNIVARAISSCIFKDIHNAQLALGGSILECAKICISLSSNEELKMAAFETLKYWQMALGQEITTKILLGMKAAGPTFEYLFNPIPLSVLCKLALDITIYHALNMGVTKIVEWDQLNYSIQKQVLVTAMRDARLYQISKY